MRRSAVVAVLTGVALLAAVVVVRGDTAAQDTDLAVGPPEPSPLPSPPPVGPVLLAANGVPGLRLGAAPPASDAGDLQTPSGCRMVWVPLGEGGGALGTTAQVSWETSAWVVDEEVVSVVLGSWSDGTDLTTDLETWFGPTFGSPIQTAQELPGARTVTQQPFGADGPTVSVVTVPARGVEVVLSDLPPFGATDRDATGPGRITTMELRKPAARACDLSEVESVGTRGRGWTVDLDGIGPLRLGADAAGLRRAQGVTTDGPPGGDPEAVAPCQTFSLTGPPGLTGVARAIAVDGVVTEVQVYDTDVGTSFGLPAGADADDVRARFPETADRPGDTMGSGAVQVLVDDVTVDLQLAYRNAWVPDLERPLQGGVPTVSGVVVRAPGAPLYPC